MCGIHVAAGCRWLSLPGFYSMRVNSTSSLALTPNTTLVIDEETCRAGSWVSEQEAWDAFIYSLSDILFIPVHVVLCFWSHDTIVKTQSNFVWIVLWNVLGYGHLLEQMFCSPSQGSRAVKQPPRCTGLFTGTCCWVHFLCRNLPPFFVKGRISSDSFPIWFYGPEIVAKTSFCGPNLADSSVAYLYFAHRVDSIYLIISVSITISFLFKHWMSKYEQWKSNLSFSLSVRPWYTLANDSIFNFFPLFRESVLEPQLLFFTASIDSFFCSSVWKWGPPDAGLTVNSYQLKVLCQSTVAISLCLIQHSRFGGVRLWHGAAGGGVWWEVQGAEITRVYLDACSRWSHPEAKVQMALIN